MWCSLAEHQHIDDWWVTGRTEIPEGREVQGLYLEDDQMSSNWRDPREWQENWSFLRVSVIKYMHVILTLPYIIVNVPGETKALTLLSLFRDAHGIIPPQLLPLKFGDLIFIKLSQQKF